MLLCTVLLKNSQNFKNREHIMYMYKNVQKFWLHRRSILIAKTPQLKTHSYLFIFIFKRDSFVFATAYKNKQLVLRKISLVDVECPIRTVNTV